jgi:hypothetical protein
MKERMYIEAPQYNLEVARRNPAKSIFMAGSITGAEDWQKELAYTPATQHGIISLRIIDVLNVFNPRRSNYDALNPELEREQITWEYQCIHQCDYILFWFAPETLAPITLFELGSALHTHDHDKIFIGTDPEYKRKNDVFYQTGLRDIKLANRIVHSKDELVNQVLRFALHNN